MKPSQILITGLLLVLLTGCRLKKPADHPIGSRPHIQLTIDKPVVEYLRIVYGKETKIINN